MSAEAKRLPQQRYTGGRAKFLEPFDCLLCGHLTRPPKRRATEPGMEGTRSYGGRGCCASCYEGSKGQRRKYNLSVTDEAFEDTRLEYTRTALQSFLERRRQRLSAGSMGAPQRQLVGAGK